MKQFNERFHTDDFDREMIDWLIEKGYDVTGNCVRPSLPSISDSFLRYGMELESFWTTNSDAGNSTYLTKQQFKEKIGMTKQDNTFTKSMLVSGEHVVELRDGTYNLVMGNRISDLDGWHILLSNLTEDLLTKERLSSLDVVAVYKVDTFFVLNDLMSGENLTLIWQRESPEEALKRQQREERLKQIQTLEEDLKRAQRALDEAKKGLER